MFRLLASLLLASAMLPAAAQAETFRSNYTISYLGLPVARSQFTSSVDGDRFSVKGSFSSSGLARIFDSTEGSTRISGRFAGGRTQPDAYEISYSEGEKKKRTAVTFANGNAVKTVNVPPLKKRDDKVPLTPANLRGVADPLSATLVRAEGIDEVCSRTIHLYDGEVRADLRLSEAGRDEWNGREAVTCNARFVPVAGYRKGKKDIQYLRDKSRITITFAELGKTGVFAPVNASIGTRIGTLTISANELEASN